MYTCAHCRRPFFLHESACPFCGAGAPAGRVARRALNAVGGVVSAMVLMACYGAPPKDIESREDFDGDGYSDLDDCDDEDSGTHPGASEVCDDDVDNDCDEVTDTADADCREG